MNSPASHIKKNPHKVNCEDSYNVNQKLIFSLDCLLLSKDVATILTITF